MNPRYRAVARIDKIVCKNRDNVRCKMQKNWYKITICKTNEHSYQIRS